MVHRGALDAARPARSIFKYEICLGRVHWGCLGVRKMVPIFFSLSHLSAISCRVDPVPSFMDNFAGFLGCTKMLVTPSIMDGFWILKILLIATTI